VKKLFPELLYEYDNTDKTGADFKKLFYLLPKNSKIQDSDNVEILEPQFPFYVRKVLINNKEFNINFSNIIFGKSTKNGELTRFLNIVRSKDYLNQVAIDLLGTDVE